MSLPDVDEIRQRIDRVQHEAAQRCLQALYLFAARVNEVVAHRYRSDEHTYARGPYGTEVKEVLYTDDRHSNVRAAVFQVHTSKRERATSTFYRQGLLRTIALPLDHDPWVPLLLAYWQRAGDTRVFPYTRQWISQYVRDHHVFNGLHYPIERYVITQKSLNVHRVVDRHLRAYTLHALRHSRTSELRAVYGFDGFDLAAYAGWTMKTSSAHTPAMAERYLVIPWTQYFPKLLTPRIVTVTPITTNTEDT